jgi:hypothetical protein
MGDYAPTAGELPLRSNDPNNGAGALFVVNTDGSSLRRITAWNFAQDPEAGP